LLTHYFSHAFDVYLLLSGSYFSELSRVIHSLIQEACNKYDDDDDDDDNDDDDW